MLHSTTRQVFVFVIIFLIMFIVFVEAQENDWEQRDQWQNVAGIFRAMGVEEGSHVADIGCQKGYLTLRLAPVVGDSGRIYAVDIDKSALADLEETLTEEKIGNVTIVHSKTDDPCLEEESLDAAIILNAYHEMEQHQKMLAHISAALKPGGRLVIVDPISKGLKEDSREDQTDEHELALRFAIEDLRKAGFEIADSKEEFVKRKTDGNTMWLLVGRKPENHPLQQ